MTTQQIRAVDATAIQRLGMNSLILMENAALGCVGWICRRFVQPVKTVVLCGPGNNGGDGLVITRHLRVLGWDCQAFLLGPNDKFTSDTRHHADLLSIEGDPSLTIVQPGSPESLNPFESAIESADLIIDSLLGTGASGDPRSPMAEWIELANSQPAFRLAIDVPTGVNADNGHRGQPWFRAHATLTFVALKPAMSGRSSGETFGSIHVLSIGIPRSLIGSLLLQDSDSKSHRGEGKA